MQNSRGIGSYQKQETLGKSPLDLLLMVYDGTIEALDAAEKAFLDDKRELARDKIARAKKFVTHLYTTLDMEKGGEVAERLAMLYVFVIEKLQGAQATGDIETLGDLRAILGNVKSGWVELRQQGEQAPDDATPVNNTTE